MTIEQYWDNLIEYGIVSEDALRLATNLAGYSVDTLDSVLFVQTGYRYWGQYSQSELSE